MLSVLFQMLGLLIFSAVVWFVGPLLVFGDLAPLELEEQRLIAIGALFALWLLAIIFVRIRAVRKNNAMIATLGESTSREIDEETRVIQERFSDALQALKDSNQGKGKKQYIYDIPWYIIIGPPGSGKTTALLNAGLTFPLEDKLGTDSIGGVGGTRNCDWWFTNEAVLIDTAGRFTTQDSHTLVDEAGWTSFISQLKRYRKAQPVNGAMVTMSLSDLMVMSDVERSNTAKTIRLRIDELATGLGIKFPIYFMFTKCDLISGFSEFFAHYGKDERAQVWGETFGIDKRGASTFDVSEYGAHFDELVDNLNAQVLDRIHEERDRDERVLMLGFPMQFSSLKSIVSEFVEEVFASNKFSEDPLLRGVYYTSGTQEGTPMDRLLGKMAVDLGLDQSSKVGLSGKGKSYFLTNVLKDVIFRESSVAGVDPSIRRRARLISALGYTIAFGIVAVCVAAWSLSYQDNLSTIDRIVPLVSKVESISNEPAPVELNLERVASELTLLQEAANDSLTDEFPDLGLKQAKELKTNVSGVYSSTLENRFLPAIASRIEERLASALIDGDLGGVYRLLKAYLMYAGLHEKAGAQLEPEFLTALNKEDWNVLFKGNDELLEQLATHEAALFRSGFSGIRANEEIVNTARTVLKASPLAEQIYQSIRQTLLPLNTYDLDFLDLAGNSAGEFFASRDGRYLGELQIPGMFTIAGYQNEILPLIETQSREYVRGNWVMGAHNKLTTPVSFEQLSSEILSEYKKEYILRWESLLANTQIKDARTSRQVNELLKVFGQINGPFQTFLESIGKQTDLAVVEEKVLSGANSLSVNSDAVRVHFSSLNSLSGSAELRSLVQNARELSLFVSEMLRNQTNTYSALEAIQGRVAGNDGDVFKNIRTKVPFLPEYVQSWVATIKDRAWKVVFEHAGDELNRAWQQDVYEPYQASFSLYPFNVDAQNSIPIADFSNLFSESGVLNRFVENRLSPFLQTTSDRWRLRTIDGEQLSVLSETLEAVRQLQLVGGSLHQLTQGSVWTFTPVNLGLQADRFVLNLGRHQSEFSEVDSEKIDVIWPYEGGQSLSGYQFFSAGIAIEPIQVNGPWSIYQLLQRSDFQARSMGEYDVQFVQNEFLSTYTLNVDGDLSLFERLVELQLPNEF